MIRIRFHGRGGHGIKTASRIVGTAAFQAGYITQDSPVYGAERRGAAIVAFTRIDEVPILERGVIGLPDLIVIGDETLLADAAAGVLGGQEQARAVFVNAASPAALASQYGIAAEVLGLDITARTLDRLGRVSTLSVGLAAAAARLTGIIDEQQLLDATREELAHLALPGDLVTSNLDLAVDVYRQLPALDLVLATASPTLPGAVVRVPHHRPDLATPSIFAAGNSRQLQTGNWRFERPEIDYDRCTRCGICFVRCPDGAIALDKDGYPVIDYDHCKGCLECWDQCPVEGAMRREKEVRAW